MGIFNRNQESEGSFPRVKIDRSLLPNTETEKPGVLVDQVAARDWLIEAGVPERDVGECSIHVTDREVRSPDGQSELWLGRANRQDKEIAIHAGNILTDLELPADFFTYQDQVQRGDKLLKKLNFAALHEMRHVGDWKLWGREQRATLFGENNVDRVTVRDARPIVRLVEF